MLMQIVYRLVNKKRRIMIIINFLKREVYNEGD